MAQYEPFEAGVEARGRVIVAIEEGIEQFRDVLAVRRLDPPRLADGVPRGGGKPVVEHVRLDLFEVGDAEFDAVRADEFHAVVLRRVVRGRDHDRRAGRLAGVADGARGRRRAEAVDVDADALESARGRVRKHLAGRAGVPGDDGAVGLPDRAGRLGDPEDELGRQAVADDAPSAARTEQSHYVSLFGPA